MLHAVFELPFLLDELLYLDQAVLPCVLLEDAKSLSEVIVLLLKLKYFCVAVVETFALSLDSLSQGQITLENLLHHVDCVNDTLGDGVF